MYPFHNCSLKFSEKFLEIFLEVVPKRYVDFGFFNKNSNNHNNSSSTLPAANLPNLVAPALDKIMRYLSGEDLMELRLVCRSLNDSVTKLDLDTRQITIYLNEDLIQLNVTKAVSYLSCTITAAENGCIVEKNGFCPTVHEGVDFIDEGMKEFSKVTKKRDFNVDELQVQFEDGDGESKKKSRQDEFYEKLGATLAKRDQKLNCRELSIGVHTPSDLKLILENVFLEKLNIKVHDLKMTFDMDQIKIIPQWNIITHLNIKGLCSLRLTDFQHIPNVDAEILPDTVANIMDHIETRLHTPAKVNMLFGMKIDHESLEALKQYLKRYGPQTTIVGQTTGRIQLGSDRFVKYTLKSSSWSLKDEK
ncbi:hypothetical protein B9Z55_023496 [Caenorhabditis nigoni]|uniref:F-box domain-containing protein n=2 Tax=Caenorhabditis nigoni TaxID=1611254 RepID=A0A2G5SQ84_9PELO|nr:hypothetical protein B9Z55_023496 [Caenorhabditis nigoni]